MASSTNRSEQIPGRIVIPGGAGYLGRLLGEYFAAQGYEIVILTRTARSGSSSFRYLVWDGETVGDWAREFEGATAVVNLAGRSVNCRYDARNRQEIYDSRLHSTRAVGEAIAGCRQPPRVWMNSSSATIYRHALDRAMDEATGDIGTGFSVDVCQKWEKTFFEAPAPQTRKVALRSAMVFGRGTGGVYEAFARIVRMGLGGALGRGDQYVSWIHAADFMQSIDWILRWDDLAGPINLASPNPLPNREFLRIFRRALGQPIGLPASRWMLEIGAFFLRTETELLLKSRRVVPGRLLESGYRFRYPEWESALQEIVAGEVGQTKIS